MRPHIRTKMNKIHIIYTTLHYALPGNEKSI